MASSWGERINLTIFGESHGAAIGAVLQGLPAGEPIDLQQLAQQMQRRRPGQNSHSSRRKEADEVQILSGLFEGRTSGAPLAFTIANSDTRPSDYAQHQQVPRPGHADFTAFVKHKGHADMRGGGHFSGRLTAPLLAAGSICRQILSRRGISIGAHIFSIADIADAAFDAVNLLPEQLLAAGKQSFPLLDAAQEQPMLQAIEQARAAGDSLGGVVECAILGLPAGLGSPMFDGVENKLAQLLFAIPAVKGVEFGAGFGLSKMQGSQANDAFFAAGSRVQTASNNCGGILGGISNGMPIIMRAAIKPTPSISRAQQTLDISNMQQVELSVTGRHDPCIVPRAVPVVEAAAALAALDLLQDEQRTVFV